MKKREGYVLDMPYPMFFYKEMQPLWLNTVLKFSGFKAPDIVNPFSYLELACATGINLLVCAIMNPHACFVGIDFNKQHIDKAKELSKLLGVENIEFIHGDFSDFLEKNTQKFDFIVNHGTFSWISPSHQVHILNIVSKFLNDSGVFYLHYMCYPGSTELQPIQKLLNLVDQQTNKASVSSIETGKKLFWDLYQAGAFINNLKIEPIIKSLENSDAYLAHEFLTDYWQPLYSVDVHNQVFQTTQLNYIGSANPCENIESISIPSNMQKIIKDTQAPALKEYLKDLARDAKQRVDVFQKKPQMLSPEVHIKTINTIKFKLLPHAPQSGAITFQTLIGEIKAPQEVISPMLESLAQQDMPFNTLLNLEHFKQNPMFLIETIFLLMQANYLVPVVDNSPTFNQEMIEKFNHKMQEEGVRLKMLKDGVMTF